MIWATACWQGRVAEVLEDLIRWSAQQEPFSAAAVAETDPRRIVSRAPSRTSRTTATAWTILVIVEQGLPVTSSLAESLVKQVSKRVKGTEMFWDDGASGEAILQLRAAVLSDGSTPG